MILEHRTIAIRGLFGDNLVAALCLGDWAVHRQLASPEMFCITLMPIGLSLPLAWASFSDARNAVAAMKTIVRMRNSWAQVTQEDLTKALADQLKAICLRFGATEGPAQFAQDCDKNSFGLPTKERLNGYHHPEIH